MSILHVTLFGGVNVTHDDWSTEVIMTPDIQAFLAYLLLQRHRMHSREVLADIFWGEVLCWRSSCLSHLHLAQVQVWEQGWFRETL